MKRASVSKNPSAEKHRQKLGILSERRAELLDDEQLVKPVRPERRGYVHIGHAAVTYRREQPVSSDDGGLMDHGEARLTCSDNRPRCSAKSQQVGNDHGVTRRLRAVFGEPKFS
jgi:hypothetical protein